MSSGDDGSRVEERSTAEVGSTLLQTDNEGEVTSSSNCSTDDVDRILGSGSSRYCGGHEASNHCFVLHSDEVLGSEVVSVEDDQRVDDSPSEATSTILIVSVMSLVDRRRLSQPAVSVLSTAPRLPSWCRLPSFQSQSTRVSAKTKEHFLPLV